MHSEITVRTERAISEKVFPGCVIGLIRPNKTKEILAFGNFTYEPNSAAVREDTIYDLASITKSIPTASLALALIAEGKLRATDRIVEYLPELKNDHQATIEDLLTYRVRGPKLSTLKDKTAEGILEHIFERGFDAPSGESNYTNLPALLLGLAIERAADQPLESLARKYFFGPLQMQRTTFFPFRDLPDKKDEIAPTEIDEWRGEVCGFPHDESAYIFAKSDRACGHAGLFSTAPDLLNFLERVLQGELPAIAEGAQKGWGWELMNRPHTFGKTGFTGTSVVVDVERGVAFAILSNRTYPKRPPDAALANSAINRFRANIADILLR
ncbi:hypothetical protein A2763_03145 [Candidatus Kaiserbacteria bacterium RIFCSPHIGHO2_01_FULL_54_36]|uniref:Beta-lactamase-related domain-containing protein n=1 Tax=Candidatus Kaiserbacteria bacterium RIFCSPHIGHO2_01_FULL_54_36 TaxID=1798482 RepID=A0A1F6CL00_9BACT|nr:MAG: hypothetical protein A2763_03145 [Candidatus Kaiserbacteria bacterium RIFCSPHIGHO2_01_FULL_54_36]OGG75395.1 MAG: hypothetical protein A3A41_02400 [Candidatus Kaiserbacteria bacterium RIFCSPLOWO2_01_FULL_54_22]